jgi:GTP-binding protein
VKFVDEAVIDIRSGDGGSGCVSFRRERALPKGGPDGGNGGAGGDVCLQSSFRENSLYRFQFSRRYRAENGRPGGGQGKTGRDGKDVTIEVPVGTVVRAEREGEVLYDFTRPGQTWIALQGGRGGKGNRHFASSVNRTPRFAQPGMPGAEKRLFLELKLIADIGIVGLPNAGKSTLVQALSAARPEIGDYPFTTLNPHLGVVSEDSRPPFVLADIPGLIQGAHRGAGLGTRFLRHIERTRALLHLIDVTAVPLEDPLRPFFTVQHELTAYGKAVAQKPMIIALNKIDLDETGGRADTFCEQIQDIPVFRISAKEKTGLSALVGALRTLIPASQSEK